MLAARTRSMLLGSLEETPNIISALLSGIAPDSLRWDALPDPERFSLREIVAHLDDVEPRWLERMTLTCEQTEPTFLPGSVDDDFSQSDPRECLARLRENRRAFVDTLRKLPEDAWERIAHSQLLGAVTIEGQAVFVLTHDGYHVSQIAAWVTQTAENAA